MPSWFLIVYLKDREKSARAGRRVLGGTMAFVEFADVSKIYQMGEVEVAAVRDMSFTIERGEFVVIVGPSGAGKTTLLNMLGGMDSATSGTITLDGARVSSFNRKQLTQYRRHDIGFVFQFYNLVQNLTARENVELASQICRDPLTPMRCWRPWAWPTGRATSRAAVRRRAAARRHRPRPGEEPQAPSVRRAHRRARLRDGQGHPEAPAGHLPRHGAHGGRRHPQQRVHRHRRPRHPRARGLRGRRGAERGAAFRRRAGVVA